MDFAFGLGVLVTATVIIVAACLGLVCYFMIKEKLTQQKGEEQQSISKKSVRKNMKI